MDKLVQDYVDTGNMLHEKYNALRFGKMIRREEMIEKFKPITEPLQELNKNLTKKPPASIMLPEMGNIATKYLNLYESDSKLVDNVFGIWEKDKELYIGSEPIKVTDNNIILINDGTVFKGTPGLWELICLQRPKQFLPEDEEQYKDLVLQCNVHKRGNNPYTNYLKSSKSYKYRNFIKHYVQNSNTMNNNLLVYGSGLHKISINRPVEYVYWNTVEELLDRLCILYGEIKAGNTNPQLLNEIVNIIQEFKEI